MNERIKELAEQAEQVQPKCGAIIEVFGKDWRLEYMSLPVGKHKLYTQQYEYTAPPQRQPLVGLTRDERMDIINRLAGQDWVYAVDAIEAKLKENT